MTIGSWLVALGLAVFPPVETTVCPATLEVEGRSVAPDGWVGGTGWGRHTFTGATLYDGAVGDRNAALAPSGADDIKAGRLQWWEFSPAVGGETPAWLECRYAGTTATIWRALPAGTTRCELTLRMDARGAVLEARPMTCQ
jgi:hypothetical protein